MLLVDGSMSNWAEKDLNWLGFVSFHILVPALHSISSWISSEYQVDYWYPHDRRCFSTDSLTEQHCSPNQSIFVFRYSEITVKVVWEQVQVTWVTLSCWIVLDIRYWCTTHRNHSCFPVVTRKAAYHRHLPQGRQGLDRRQLCTSQIHSWWFCTA